MPTAERADPAPAHGDALRPQSQLVLPVSGLVLVARLLGVHGYFCTLDGARCAIGGHGAFTAGHSHGGFAAGHVAEAAGPDCAGDCEAEVRLQPAAP